MDENTRIILAFIAMIAYFAFTVLGTVAVGILIIAAVMGCELDTMERCFIAYYILMQGMFWLGVWLNAETTA